MTQGRSAVFLDRDGVLNEAVVRDGRPFQPDSLAALRWMPDAPAQLARLKAAGFTLVVVTNQPDVGHGRQSQQNVEQIHAALRERLPVDDVFVSYDTDDSAPLRKPNPGMLLAAAAKHGIDLTGSFMVGDRWKDVEAGRRAGCTTLFVDRGYCEPFQAAPADFHVANLTEAVDAILRTQAFAAGPAGLLRLRTKIFADGADRDAMLKMYAEPHIKGFTTNPTLMCKAGIRDYEAFARDVLAAIPDRPISFEVFSDEFLEMRRQALRIAAWGANVYVKIPVTNTRREPSTSLIRELAQAGVKQNVTAR